MVRGSGETSAHDYICWGGYDIIPWDSISRILAPEGCLMRFVGLGFGQWRLLHRVERRSCLSPSLPPVVFWPPGISWELEYNLIFFSGWHFSAFGPCSVRGVSGAIPMTLTQTLSVSFSWCHQQSPLELIDCLRLRTEGSRIQCGNKQSCRCHLSRGPALAVAMLCGLCVYLYLPVVLAHTQVPIQGCSSQPLSALVPVRQAVIKCLHWSSPQ